MALDDYLEPEIAVAVAATAALTSPPVRRAMRRGLVLGLAGVLTAGEWIASVGRGAVPGAAAAPAGEGVTDRAQAGPEADGRRRTRRAEETPDTTEGDVP